MIRTIFLVASPRRIFRCAPAALAQRSAGPAALVSAMAVVVMVSACGRDAVEQAKQAPQAIDLSADARKEAVIEAATQHFNQTVRDTFLVRQRMTVRGLARSATRATKPAASLHAARFDPAARSSAKLELIDGKVVYTAVASSDDQAAAVISDGAERWAISYEVAAQLTPDGELKDFEIRRLGEATRVD
ncbi:MAG: hypothetical protein Q8L48_42430 [Archangium sp.]|nr:hypothetical protein [Archangium sp.]